MGEDESEEFDWRVLGTFGPHTTAQSSGPRCDRGPGGSLLDEAERARRLRLAGQPRWIAPRVLYAGGGTAVLLGLVLIVSAGITGAVLGSLAMLAAVTSILIGVRMHVARTGTEARLRQRAWTERRVAAELGTLAADGWVMLHDRLLPGTHHRLAHVAVGPAGVVVVTPMPVGLLQIVGHEVEGDDYRQLYAGSLHLDTWLNARRWEVAQLEPAIAQSMQDIVWSGPTVPIAVHVPPRGWREWVWPRRAGADVPDMPFEWRGVELRPLSAVVAMLSGLPSPLSRTEVASVASVVEQLCPPAGRADGHESSAS